MNPIEILQKPLPKFNFKSLQAVPSNIQTPLPSIKPVSVFNKISAPLPPKVMDTAQKYAGPKVEPLNKATSSLPAFLKPLVAPLPKGLVQVRPQGFKDVVNAIPEIANAAINFIGKPVGDVVLSLKGIKDGVKVPLIPLPFPNQGTYPVDSQAPDWFKSKLETETKQSLAPVVVYGAWQDYVEQHNKGLKKPAVELESWQTHYDKSIEAGDSPTKAFLKTGLKAGLDLSVVIPIFRGIGKVTLLKTAPERLVNPEVVTLERNALRDYFSGRTPAVDIPTPLREAIADVMKTGTRAEKNQLLRGIDMVNAKPSTLGKLFGITEEEASSIIQELYGGPVRPAPSGALPGFRETPGQPAPAGLSIRKLESVGGKNWKPDPKLYAVIEEPKTPKQQEIQTDMIVAIQGKTSGIIDDALFAKKMTKLEGELRATLGTLPKAVSKEVVTETKISPELEPLAKEAIKYKSAEEFTRQTNLNGIVPQWGTRNQYLSKNPFREELSSAKLYSPEYKALLRKERMWELEQVLKDKPAYLNDGLSTEELKNFAQKNNLSYAEANGREVVAKTQEAAMKVIDAEDQRELGLALGYKDLGQTFTKSQLTDFYNKAKGKSTEFAKKGQDFKPTVTKEEATKIIRGMFSESEIGLTFDPKLAKKGYSGLFETAGTGSFGQRLKPMITLLEKNGMVDDRTAYHEAFHAHFNTYLTGSERQLALDKVKSNLLTKAYKLKTEYGTADEKAEEWLADDFADYARTGKSKGGFVGLWERLLQKIRNLIRRTQKLKDLYDDILKGKTKPGEVNAVTRANKIPEERLGDWQDEAAQELTEAEKQLALKTKAIHDLKNRGLTGDQEAIELMKLERDFAEQARQEMPGKKLVKYQSRTTGDLPEVTGRPTKRNLNTGKIVKNSLWGQKGDDLAQNMFGFGSVDEAKTALDKYLAQRKRVESIKKTLADRVEDFSSKRAILRELRKEVAAETESRINKIRAIQAFFKLPDQDMSKIMGFKGMRNISLMTNRDFANFLKRMEGQASANFILAQERIAVEGTIYEKELVKVDNLRKALKLPEIKNMSVSQLREFGALIDTFEHGDEFLGVRQLETVKNTELGKIHTVREAREIFMKESGARPDQIGEIIQRGASDFDDIRAASLPDVSPFHKLVYEDMIRVFLDRDRKLLELENQLFPLTRLARKSRGRGIGGRLVPTDKKIWEWLNATTAEKLAVMPEMTAPELSVAHLMQDWLAEARDYLIKAKVLKGTRFYNNYISHVQRDFLEAVKDDGLMTAFREMKLNRQLVEANFEILSGKEGDILPLEKFFRYSQRRPDGMNPSKNVPKVFMQYARAFYTKQALDQIVPKLVIYAHTLTPKRMTPRGLEYNDSLKRWLNAYVNSQKGRPPAVLRNLIKPGGKVDWGLRTGIAFMRILDLGFNLAVQVAAPIGEQMAMLPGLRTRQALGLARIATPKGRAVAKKYQNFVGKTLIETLREPTTHIGQKGLSAIFAGFSIGSRKASQVWLLSSMNKAEWAAGEISSKRLAEIKARMSRYRSIEKSILGTTSLGQTTTQYRSWAIPILSRNISNISKLSRMVRNGSWKKAGTSEEFRDTLASVITTTAIALAVYNLYSSLKDKKDRTLLEDVAFKAARESMTIIGAMDPTLYTASPRLLSFFYDLSSSLKLTLQGERYKTGDNRGELKGVVKLQKTLTPKAFSQLGDLGSLGGGSSSLGKLKSLQGIKLKPKEGLEGLKLNTKSDLSGIKLVPKEKINLKEKEGGGFFQKLNNLFGVQKAEASMISPDTGKLDTERIKSEIAFRESGISKTPYNAINDKNKNGTADYGKYQVNEKTLKTYSKKFLGREVTPQEFLKSPALQEKFVDSAIKHLHSLGAKSLDAFLILWHKGWGDISTKRILKLKEDPEVKKYLNNKRRT